MPHKVIELIRVSTESQRTDDRASVPAQKSVNARTCAQYGLEIVRTIEVSDVSGAAVLSSPEFALLRSLMRNGIHGVVAREFSRLMRPENFEDYALLQDFVNAKAILYLADGPIDLASKAGRLLGPIRAAIAGLERTEMLERIWSAKESKRRRGELGQSSIVLPFAVGYESGRFFYKPEAERVREAFIRFLAGEHNYNSLAELMGVTPRGAHLILRNPIWTGWRVIDKRRDSSASGKYGSLGGRQSDRRKIARAPEDVIRVKVIDEPLIPESDFQVVQRIMDAKQIRHWRSQPNVVHRWTYNGFLTCSACASPIHTRLARRDYYVCSQSCGTKYMGRERLDSALDYLFSERLTDRGFLEQCVSEVKQRSEQTDSGIRLQRLNAELQSLAGKRERTIESFIEGVITRAERDLRLTATDSKLTQIRQVIMSESPALPETHSIVEVLAPLAEFAYWNREQKRSVLASLIPDIRVADYKVESLGLNASLFIDERSHSRAGYFKADSSLLYIPIGLAA